jgi:stage II sporulation protein D
MDVTEEGILFTTKGYGHRVGMSQYGAQAMALSGSRYGQILGHYYRGTLLTNWEAK